MGSTLLLCLLLGLEQNNLDLFESVDIFLDVIAVVQNVGPSS